MSSLVFFTARMDATSATTRGPPFLTSPSLMASTVDFLSLSLPTAVALLGTVSFPETSIMLTWSLLTPASLHPDDPVRGVLPLPYGHPLLQLIDHVAARLEALVPVPRRDAYEYYVVAYLQVPVPVDDLNPIHAELVRGLACDGLQLGPGHALVDLDAHAAHGPSIRGVPHGAHEGDDAATAPGRSAERRAGKER